MKSVSILSVVLLFLSTVLWSFQHKKNKDDNALLLKRIYISNLDELIKATEKLEASINNRNSLRNIKENLNYCRLTLKKAEPMLFFFDRYNFNLLLGDPVPEWDTEAGKEVPPHGLIILEELLLEEKIDWEALNKEVYYIHKAAVNSRSGVQNILFSDKWLFQALRVELIKSFTINLSGLDNTDDSRFIKENKAVFESISKILKVYDPALSRISQSAMAAFARKTTFNTFDRISFYKTYLDKLYKEIQQYCIKNNIEFPDEDNYFNTAFNSKSLGLFDADFSKPYFHFPFRSLNINKEQLELGKLLFYDPFLSGNGKRSCASCHIPNKAFTDGLKTAISFNGKSFLKRNTPTLINSGLQSAFQLDGNAMLPEEQFEQVMFHPEEMGITQHELIQRLNAESGYKILFQKAFNLDSKAVINDRHVFLSLGLFLRSLNSMDSDFDKYMRGDLNIISIEIKNGFNIFMGKGQCGTCHFVPYFNGLKPPFFEETENEIIGVPSFNIFKNRDSIFKVDEDQGLYYHTQERNHYGSFKTPTLRNISLTSPYMHNGVFETLEDVVEFYNSGGANGFGGYLENQTLPADSLNLNVKEISDLIMFLKSLESTGKLEKDIPLSLPLFSDSSEYRWLNSRSAVDAY